jgi:ABC-type spermidine/putrescine transport system permease subunit I
MTHAPAEIAIEYEVTEAPVRQGLSIPRIRGIALLAPALAVAVLFSIIPLIYLVRISLTEESTFFFTAQNTWDNYRKVFDQYRPAFFETVYLAVLASAVDLVLGYPFAYILIAKSATGSSYGR